MKFKTALSSATLLLISNTVWADQAAYYDVEEISVDAEGANYGAYPSAISDDGTLIGSYSMKSSLSRDIDIGLPFTFNRSCQYDDEICELEFYGSESSDDDSYENAYQVWRNAQSNAEADGYSSYMMANILDTSETADIDSTTTDADTGIDTITFNSINTAVVPYEDSVDSTDVKVTDVAIIDGDNIVIGYSSDVYDSSNEREFVRRAFIKHKDSDEVTSLLPDFTTNGGFSSAYKIKEVTYGDGSSKTLVVGASSISFPQDDDSDDQEEYFNNCYFSDESDYINTLNELVNCPGFDTQAWAWDVSGVTDSTQDISGFELASEWLDDNEDNDDSDITYSASALDINASGIAVGVSTFEYSDSATGGRQRAIIMTPDDSGDYSAPTELAEASYTGEEGESSDDDGIYNTWATAITDSNVVIGNREYSKSKSVNLPTEFFVYDIDEESISFPLEDLKVLTTEQRLNGDSSAKTGANSHAYDINESGFIVGKADDYDQTHAVYGGSPRTQSAFLYNNNTDESWFINDLICTETDGVVTSPRYKIRSARVINDDGTVLAEGWKYDSDADYQDETNATEVMLKLTRNTEVSLPDDSPNCWQSDLLGTDEDDESYSRSGAADFWLWLFALPLLLVRRFCK